MKNKILITCLFYINDNNKNYRIKNCLESLESLKKLNKDDFDIIAVANNCSPSFTRRLNREKVFKEVIDLKENFWDTSVIYSAAYLAKKNKYKYCLYTYDDFVFYNHDFGRNCIQFLNRNSDCSCIRIPKWEYERMDLYNSQITSKSSNPDAVRHYQNTGFDESNVSITSTAKLKWEGPIDIGSHSFYKTNWHYVSRPTIWRPNDLLSLFDEEMPVMQKLECNLGQKFHQLNKKTGVLDGGACYTFQESIRANNQGKNVKINISELKEKIKDIK